MSTPNDNAHGLTHQSTPTGISVLSVATSLHVKACIDIKCRTAKTCSSLGTLGQATLGPVIVKEIDVGYRLVCRCMVEPVLVVAVKLTAVVAQATGIGYKSIPIYMEWMTKFLGYLVTLGKERNETVIHLQSPITLGIETKAVDTVIFEELDKFA